MSLTARYPLVILLFSLAAFTAGCRKNKADIVHKTMNSEFVFPRSMEEIEERDDAIANHIDSILNGLINTEIVSTGYLSFDLNGDQKADFSFEIVDLNPLNPQGLPETFDTLAVRVIPHRGAVLDNSTFGYPDALATGVEIGAAGHWRSDGAVLATFGTAGRFKGLASAYLGIRLSSGGEDRYGWVRIGCSADNDTLRILEYAYNDVPNGTIRSGQTE